MSDTEQGTEQAEPTEAPPTPPHTVIGPEPDEQPAPGVEGEPMPSEPAAPEPAPTEGEGEGDATDDTSDGGPAGE